MKIPCIIDLDISGAKDYVNNIINCYGKTKDVNQVAMTVFCVDEVGNSFTITQFHNNRRFITIGAGEA